MTPKTIISQSHIITGEKSDPYHRIKLLQAQKLWEGRYVTQEKRKPAMLKVVVFTGEVK